MAVLPYFGTDLLAQTSVTTTCDPNAQTLKKGDSGEYVVTLQNLLVEKGYIDGDYVDGDFGPGTEGVVKQFQTDNGLTADGIVGPTTWQTLCSIGDPPSDETLGMTANMTGGNVTGDNSTGTSESISSLDADSASGGGSDGDKEAAVKEVANAVQPTSLIRQLAN